MWTLMLLPVAVAAVVLLVRRAGRPVLSALSSVRVRLAGLIWAAALVQLFRGVLPPGVGPLPVVLIWVLGATFVVVNLGGRPAGVRAGLVLLALGFTLNTVAILANGAMPVSADAARAAGFAAGIRPDGRYEPLSDATVLPALGDIVAVPGLQKVISLGDLVMLAGITGLLVAAARWSTAASSATAPTSVPDRGEVNRT
jgi:hypothetical protein